MSVFSIHYHILVKTFYTYRALVSDTANLGTTLPHSTVCSIEHQAEDSDDEKVGSAHSTAGSIVASDSEDAVTCVTASDSEDIIAGDSEESDSEESEESDSEESDTDEVTIASEAEDDVTCDSEDEIEDCMFDPIYKDANISLVGAYWNLNVRVVSPLQP